MRLAPHHHLVGQHGTGRRDKRGRAVLLLEGDRDAAGLEQPEHVAGGRGGELALVRDHVELGAVARGDVILGDDCDQIGTGDPEYFLGLSLGDKRAERKGFGMSGRWGVHDLSCSCEKRSAENNDLDPRHLGRTGGFSTRNVAGSNSSTSFRTPQSGDPESIAPVFLLNAAGYGFRVRELRSRPGMTPLASYCAASAAISLCRIFL